MGLKKAVRTLQVELPFLLDFKFRAMRHLRSAMRRPFERDFLGLPLLQAPPDAEFLDVGANRGQSIDAIHMMCPQVRVRAFEPNSLLFGRLESQFAGNNWLQLHNVGLGDQDMDATLHVPFYKRWMFDGLASFDEQEARGWLSGRMYFYSEAHLRVERSLCRVRRLDDLGARPFFIKIDVQGFELQVLQGGRQTLVAHRPVLLIEAPGQPILQFLAALDYVPCAFDGLRFVRGVKGGLNTFFLPPAMVTRLGSQIVAS